MPKAWSHDHSSQLAKRTPEESQVAHVARLSVINQAIVVACCGFQIPNDDSLSLYFFYIYILCIYNTAIQTMAQLVLSMLAMVAPN